MALVTVRELTGKARREGYAIPAFSVDNLEAMEGVLKAAEKMRAPVILLVGQNTLKHTRMEYFPRLAREMARHMDTPFALQLDHGTGIEQAVQALAAGFPSVMFDGSALGFDENVARTKEIVRIARAVNACVEGELGTVLRPESGEDARPEDYFTDPRDAEAFVAQTGVDALAVAVGSRHGQYGGGGALDFPRLEAISRLVPVPLVLHGGTGVSDEDVRRAIGLGIAKVNIGTELRGRSVERIAEALADGPPSPPDFLRVSGIIRATAEEVAAEKIRLCTGRGGVTEPAMKGG